MRVNRVLTETEVFTFCISVLCPLISKIHRNPKTDDSFSTWKASLHPSLRMEHVVCECREESFSGWRAQYTHPWEMEFSNVSP